MGVPAVETKTELLAAMKAQIPHYTARTARVMSSTDHVKSPAALLVGRTVTDVRQHREQEVLIEFADGVRLMVDGPGRLELSVTAGASAAIPVETRGTPPSLRQADYARSLGIDPEDKSARVVSAEIQDQLEAAAQVQVEERGLRPGVRVRYTGARTDMPRSLVISAIARNGFVYFKRTPKYCRPWYLETE